MINDN